MFQSWCRAILNIRLSVVSLVITSENENARHKIWLEKVAKTRSDFPEDYRYSVNVCRLVLLNRQLSTVARDCITQTENDDLNI